ncbi:MAG: hypothetical protein QOJ45_2769 [Verrucomicrobiota bacterium]|jgi:hypothetical protein
MIAGVLFFAAIRTRAVILFATDDPTANTTAPIGALANSGWQYEGIFGAFLGTPIAAHYFITAQHIGVQSSVFTYQGAQYDIRQQFDDPASDLRIYRVLQVFPSFAPLYGGNAEIGKHLVVIGRGTRRGPGIFLSGTLQGWSWGAGDGITRWGENDVSAIIPLPGLGNMLFASFDQNGRPNEAHLSSGDSAGALFVDDAGVWKLAGINYAVDGPFYTDATGGGAFLGALFDRRGFYEGDAPPYAPVIGDAPVPSGFYATRLSSNRGWIDSVIGPGMPNISSRAFVDLGDNAAIAGFIVRGDRAQPKQVVVRGIGPSLKVNTAPFPGRLMDPMLELRDSRGALLFFNDNWRLSLQQAAIEASGLAPTDDNEAVIIATLSPGSYTAILRGANNSSGIGLIEVYDADNGNDPEFVNLSTRARVGTGDKVLIGGVIVRAAQRKILFRALGPSLAAQLTGTLLDPELELHDGNGTLITSNDNWPDAPNRDEIIASTLAPTDIRESAIFVATPPGNYTAIVRGAGGAAGIGLLELYLLE